jgi:hypothetical protein
VCVCVCVCVALGTRGHVYFVCEQIALSYINACVYV